MKTPWEKPWLRDTLETRKLTACLFICLSFAFLASGLRDVSSWSQRSGLCGWSLKTGTTWRRSWLCSCLRTEMVSIDKIQRSKSLTEPWCFASVEKTPFFLLHWSRSDFLRSITFSFSYLLSLNSRSKANFSFQFIASYLWYSKENLAGDLLFGLKFVEPSILPTLFIHFV